MSNLERRSLVLEPGATTEPLLRVERRCETPEEDGERDWIVGYAAKFGVNSLEIDGEFTERIAPGAFGLVTERRGRRLKLETRALFNHNADMPLARYPRTLKLFVDDVGLRYEFPVPRSSYGQDLAANIRDGIVAGSSFSFTVAKGGDEWSVEEGRSVRTVKQIDALIDVGPVTFPAYPDADVTVARRSFDVHRRGAVARKQRIASRRARLGRVLLEARASLATFLRQHGV
jgi:HK97 family phage prohead protease